MFKKKKNRRANRNFDKVLVTAKEVPGFQDDIKDSMEWTLECSADVVVRPEMRLRVQRVRTRGNEVVYKVLISENRRKVATVTMRFVNVYRYGRSAMTNLNYLKDSLLVVTGVRKA